MEASNRVNNNGETSVYAEATNIIESSIIIEGKCNSNGHKELNNKDLLEETKLNKEMSMQTKASSTNTFEPKSGILNKQDHQEKNSAENYRFINRDDQTLITKINEDIDGDSNIEKPKATKVVKARNRKSSSLSFMFGAVLLIGSAFSIYFLIKNRKS